MVVEKPIKTEEAIERSTPIDIEIGPEQDPNIQMMDDGSAVIGEVPQQPEMAFGSNLADFMSEDDLMSIANELIGKYDDDKTSRKDWEDTYTKGLDLLGFKYEERSQPFQGASGVTHPVLAEAVTQFQAQAYRELLPAGGPVRTQIVGKEDTIKQQQAERVQEFMNYQIMHVMEEYDPELDQMLFHLPLAGSAFKKVYFDTNIGRAVSKFVPADDLVVPYNATDLQSSEREEILQKINNAGGIFLGDYSTEVFGDYVVGTNHVLPTSGAAKFSSGLGVIDFMKKSSVVEMNQTSFKNLSKHVENISDVENLDAHKLSVTIRQTK